jgi:hypothetical protein
MLDKIVTLEKQAVLTTTSVRDDIRDITELNTTRTDELSHKLSTHLHLSDLRNKSARWRKWLSKCQTALDNRMLSYHYCGK